MQTTAAATADEVLITIFIPCYNEEKYVGGTLSSLQKAMETLQYRYDVVVIDDCSSDRTSEVVRAWQKEHPLVDLKLVRNEKNRGLSRSFVDGAFVGRGKYYRLLCGDDPESPETMIELFRRVGEADMILPYYPEVPGKSRLRIWISGCYTFLINCLSGYKIKYYNGGGIHLRYNIMRWGSYSFGFGFQAELVTRLLDDGATYVEVASRPHHRDKPAGASALNFRNFLSVTHTLMEVAIRRIRRKAFER